MQPSPPLSWVNKTLYPFASNFISIDGHDIHYVDEGTGPVIVFVHGTPEWSFGYREVIQALRPEYRCIAIDHLGFGLSDKPVDADYTVAAQALRLEQLIRQLNLRDINIVANDFGGGIALAYAIRHQANVQRICIFNTWMWSLSDNPHFAKPGKFIKGWVGKILYRQFNFSINYMLPKSFHDRSKLTPDVLMHYKQPFANKKSRSSLYTFATEILNAGPWWEAQWKAIETIADKPFLICWGMQDKFITPDLLDKWKTKLPNAQVIQFSQAGHFIQEEEPARFIASLNEFLHQ